MVSYVPASISKVFGLDPRAVLYQMSYAEAIIWSDRAYEQITGKDQSSLAGGQVSKTGLDVWNAESQTYEKYDESKEDQYLWDDSLKMWRYVCQMKKPVESI